MNIDARLNIYHTNTANRQQFAPQTGARVAGASQEPVNAIEQIQKVGNNLTQDMFQTKLNAKRDESMVPVNPQKGQKINILV